MATNCNIPHPLKREGLSQYDRYPVALDSEYVKLDERSVNDLLSQSAEYAKYINYYGNENPTVASNNWKEFFTDVYDYDLKRVRTEVIAGYQNNGDAPPHIALFLAFLEIFGFAQEQLNNLAHEHIDFFYKKVLRLHERDFVPDHAVVFMELNKNIEQLVVKKGTFLKGGKDNAGRERFYKTLRDTTVNRAAVAEIKTLFNEVNGSNVNTGLYAYPIAKSSDGFGTPFEDEQDAWMSFGKSGTTIPEVGFAISSPVFDLPDGDRTIVLDIDPLLTHVVFEDTYQLRYTSPDGWAVPHSYAIKANVPGKIEIKLLVGDPAFVPYNEELHTWRFATDQPVLLVTLKPTHKQNLYGIDYTRKFRYAEMTNIFLGKINISVSVKGSTSFIIQNDNGLLDVAKPFLPFGNIPVMNKSRFYISSRKIFNRYLKKIIFKIDWKGHPGDLSTYYDDYYTWKPKSTLIPPFELTYLIPKAHWDDIKSTYIPGVLEVLDQGQWVKLYFEKYKKVPDCEVILAILINAILSSQNLPANYPIPNRPLFKDELLDELTYENQGKISALADSELKQYDLNRRNGVARFTLDKDFGHRHFANLLTKRSHEMFTMAANTRPANLALPNQPYTPELNSISVNYELETSVLFDVAGTQSSFYHVYPFGYQKVSEKTTLVPPIPSEGNIYIGISNIAPPATVSLYFHFWEDSGDINTTLTANDGVVWEYLAGDSFKVFPEANILENSTSKFTTSGIIRFAFPSDAALPHTQLPAANLWIRGRVKANSAAYPMLIDIKSQACEVVFENRLNSLEHLTYGVPAETITKFESKLAEVKKVTQPFPSFGGRVQETQKAFYTRVSERLRHKNRAWEIKNYERLLLHNFEYVYRVKCISHASSSSEYAPGHVLIVPIPRMVNAVTQNPLEPRIKLSQLMQMREFLEEHISKQVKVEVVNPTYELIKMNVGVKFRPGYNDEAIYKKELNDTLVKYLAPWVNDDPSTLSFGSKIYTSQLIKVIEQQEYVDYITKFDVKKLKPDGQVVTVKNVITPSNESVILTSAPTHIIDTSINC